MNELIIFSGGPGSGKTTLLENLKKSHPCHVFDEVPRYLIEKHLKEGNNLLPWVDLPKFADLCYREMMKQKSHGRSISFVDRAIGDIIAYLHIGGYSGEEYRDEAIQGYYRTVFLLKPQESIYRQDEVRPHTFNEAMEIHREIIKVYDSLGFSIIEIPFMPLETQRAMVIELLGL